MTPPLEKNSIEYYRIVVVFYSAPKVFYRIYRLSLLFTVGHLWYSIENRTMLKYSIVLL